MSANALRAIFSPDADDDLMMLLTIYDPVNTNTVIARLSDSFTKRLSETADDVVYGTTSNGYDYTFLPMQITLPSEEDGQAPRFSIVLHDVTRYITPLIRTISAPPRIKLELVLTNTPNIVEISFDYFYINGVTYNANTVTFELSMIDYAKEPFPMHSFTPRYFPGLF
jgi:hypothetical protein